MPYTDRLDYFCALANNFSYALAVEKLAGIEVPERAQYLRVIMAELTRLINHIVLVGFLLNDLGAFFTPVLYAFREREKLLDLFEDVTGSRMMCNYFRFGGVKRDVPPDFILRVREIVNQFPKFLDELEELLTHNEILLSRCQNVGILPKALAVNAGITGKSTSTLYTAGLNSACPWAKRAMYTTVIMSGFLKCAKACRFLSKPLTKSRTAK